MVRYGRLVLLKPWSRASEVLHLYAAPCPSEGTSRATELQRVAIVAVSVREVDIRFVLLDGRLRKLRPDLQCLLELLGVAFAPVFESPLDMAFLEIVERIAEVLQPRQKLIAALRVIEPGDPVHHVETFFTERVDNAKRVLAVGHVDRNPGHVDLLINVPHIPFVIWQIPLIEIVGDFFFGYNVLPIVLKKLFPLDRIGLVRVPLVGLRLRGLARDREVPDKVAAFPHLLFVF